MNSRSLALQLVRNGRRLLKEGRTKSLQAKRLAREGAAALKQATAYQKAAGMLNALGRLSVTVGQYAPRQAGEPRLGPTQVAVLSKMTDKPMPLAAIAKAISKKMPATISAVIGLARVGKVKRVGRGLYQKT